jgi:SAM-dependent methyltransferase
MSSPSDSHNQSKGAASASSSPASDGATSVRQAPGRREFTREVTEFETADQVAKYQAWRYGTSGQARVDQIERSRLSALLGKYVGRGPLRALDIPCGYGRISPLLFGLDYELMWGDVSPAMAGTTAAHFKAQLSIGAFGADIAALPLADNSADLTVTIRLFHHVAESDWRSGILQELGRVSRRWCVVSFYDSASLHKLSKGLAKRLQGRTSKITMMSRSQFRKEAAAAGLKVRAFSAVARGLHAHTLALLETGT